MGEEGEEVEVVCYADTHIAAALLLVKVVSSAVNHVLRVGLCTEKATSDTTSSGCSRLVVSSRESWRSEARACWSVVMSADLPAMSCMRVRREVMTEEESPFSSAILDDMRQFLQSRRKKGRLRRDEETTDSFLP